MISPILIDLNPAKLNYFPFTAGLGKCNGSYNDADDLSTKLYVPIKAKGINATVFNKITSLNKAKTFEKDILLDFK